MANDAYTQLQTFCSNMQGYFTGLKANFNDPTQPMPMFGDIISNFNYDQLLTGGLSLEATNRSVTTAAYTDATHMISAVSREYGIRAQRRSDYFLSASTESDVESNYYQAYAAQNGSAVIGTSPDQT